MLSFVLFFSISLSSAFRDYFCVVLLWTWDKLCFRYWRTAVELTYIISEVTKHEIKSCNVEILIMEILCLDTLKYPVTSFPTKEIQHCQWHSLAWPFLLSMVGAGVSVPGILLSPFRCLKAAYRDLTEIQESSLILETREFYRFEENWRKADLEIMFCH